MSDDQTFANDLAADLRALAGYVERDPHLAELMGFSLTRSGIDLIPDGDDPKAAMAAAIRSLRAMGKVSLGYGARMFTATAQLRVLKLKAIEYREKVCEAVVVDTREVEVPDPEYLAAAPMVTKTEMMKTISGLWRQNLNQKTCGLTTLQKIMVQYAQA